MISPFTLGSTTKFRPDSVESVLATASISAFTKLSVTNSSLFLEDTGGVDLCTWAGDVVEGVVVAEDAEVCELGEREGEGALVVEVAELAVTAVALVTAEVSPMAQAVINVTKTIVPARLIVKELGFWVLTSITALATASAWALISVVLRSFRRVR